MTTLTTTRRVHFAEDVRRSPSRTPSPTHSDSSSSAASSAGPSTPPMFASLLPSSTISASATPSPDGSTGPAQIHAAIAFKPDALCQLGWDVAVHPSRLSPPYGVSADVWSNMLHQPATHPPMPSMTVLSSLLPYPIVVRAANADKGAHSPGTPSGMLSPGGHPPMYVTVHDVLHTLYASLRTPLTHEEYNALELHHQQDVARAYSTRVSRIEERKREFERSKGVKRVDLLLAEGQPIFNGLGATKRSRDVWVLNLTS